MSDFSVTLIAAIWTVTACAALPLIGAIVGMWVLSGRRRRRV